MTDKDGLHRLVDRLSESEVHAARWFLEFLCKLRDDPVLRALREAPDDEEPLSPEEAAESEAAWQAHLEGRDKGELLKKVRRELP